MLARHWTARDARSLVPTLVPAPAARSIWLSAVWTGVGAAVVCAVTAVVAVAVCWLPVSGGADHASRTLTVLRAGLLTFLTSLHGGVTLDGAQVAWLPLGMLLAVIVVARRAGVLLADAATALSEHEPHRLIMAGWLQAASFTGACLVAAPFASVGTSHAPFLSVGAAGLLVWAASAGVTVVCSGPLRERCSRWIPPLIRDGIRAGVAALLVVLAGGALLTAVALVVHREAVANLTASLGGGWNGVPVLLLGVLAAPNAVIAGGAYLVGAGFAVGHGSVVSPFGTTLGAVPSFPLLGAAPTGGTADAPTLVLIGCTIAGGALVAGRLMLRSAGTWLRGLQTLLIAAVTAAALGALLAWQSGGALGQGRLAAVGVSPWRLAGALLTLVALGGGAVYAAGHAAAALRGHFRGRAADAAEPVLAFPELHVPRPRLVTVPADMAETTAVPGDELAG